jgi:hypothetical protein
VIIQHLTLQARRSAQLLAASATLAAIAGLHLSDRVKLT